MAESTMKNLAELDLTKVDFFGLMAQTADEMKEILVMQLVILAGKGDPAALRILEKAFAETKPKDEKNKPIPILGGITQPNALPGNYSTP